MARYFNKVTKNEAVPGLHAITGDCVELPDDNPYWHPLPHGKTIGYDSDGMPVLINDVPSVEEKSWEERNWRNAEIQKVLNWMNQIFNDDMFDTHTFSLPYTATQLNAYRVALCGYPDSEGFPNGPRPNIDDFS